ncbi:MAG TPA: C4-type zinc ribbon domain-containing protein [Promineifilum sp.]|nr:C4-type zinc ribbon domain-containing protein [Promineifilum sp.]
MSQARVLYNLQQTDTEIRAKKQRLGEVLRLQKEPAALVAAREHAQAAETELQKRRMHHQALSQEIAALVDKARRSEERLYSGAVKNPKELTDLQHEVEALARRRAGLEDEALLALMAVDEQQAIKDAADTEASRLLGEFEATSISLRQEQQTLALHLNELIEKRGRQAALAQPAQLKVYDQLLQQKNGLAVVALQANKCQGCRLTLSASVIRAADEGKLIRCDNCDRFLCPV